MGVTASYCSETPQTPVTAKKPTVSFADNDVVIPPSATVDPAKIDDDDDKDTVVETCSESSDEFVTAPRIQQTATSIRPDRKMFPRRRDMVSKSVDNRIAIKANSDGFFVGACFDRKIRDGVSQRIEPAELSGSRNKWPHVLRRLLQKSLLSDHSESFDSATEEEESHDRDTRKMLHIGESDDDCRCNIRSPPKTVRKRYTIIQQHSDTQSV